MTDLFHPDRSQFQGKTPVTAHVIVARATEGDWLVDPTFEFNQQQAHDQHAFFGGYHFLEDGSTAEAQARHCHAIAGSLPMMLDLEPIMATAAADAGSQGHACGSAWPAFQAWRATMAADGVTLDDASALAAAPFISKPGIQLALAFIDAYRKLGGTIHNLYLPHWYWQVLGSPSLAAFAERKVFLTSSDYSHPYSDTGPGWTAYGGMKPQVWQYTSAGPGHQDWNAFKARAATIPAAVAELAALWKTGSRTPPKPTVRLDSVKADGTLTLHGLVADHPGNGVGSVLKQTLLNTPGRDWPSGMGGYIDHGDWDAPLPEGARVWYWAEMAG